MSFKLILKREDMDTEYQQLGERSGHRFVSDLEAGYTLWRNWNFQDETGYFDLSHGRTVTTTASANTIYVQNVNTVTRNMTLAADTMAMDQEYVRRAREEYRIERNEMLRREIQRTEQRIRDQQAENARLPWYNPSRWMR